MAFLFVHFTGEHDIGEQIYFSVSKDGLFWKDLNDNKPVIISHVGEKGLRDPFPVRKQDGSGFVIIATDLRIASQKGWDIAQEAGSPYLAVTESKDLISWSEPVLTKVAPKNAGCVWAPEAIYDEDAGNYMVFWASKTPDAGEDTGRTSDESCAESAKKETKQKIYCARTTDFINYTEAELYIERENHVIDTTMTKEAGVYYRFSKDETTKNIRVDKSCSLDKDSFEPVSIPVLDQLYGVEGPEIYYLPEREEWCLIVDRFAVNGGYLPLCAKTLASGDFRILADSEYDMGKTKKRHGGILEITDEEYERLLNHSFA